MAARFVRDEEVVGSNPATPTAVRPGQGPDPRERVRPLIGLWGLLGVSGEWIMDAPLAEPEGAGR